MEADGYRSMKRLLTVRPHIDAVFAANDPAAIGAMKAIWEAGLRVPRDIAVVGVGDIALGDLLRVPLTTVGWSRKEQGRNAAELLLRGVEQDGADDPQRVIIPPQLIVRESRGSRRHRAATAPSWRTRASTAKPHAFPPAAPTPTFRCSRPVRRFNGPITFAASRRCCTRLAPTC
jgi:ABC-type sugar transport system substrate-binding protein